MVRKVATWRVKENAISDCFSYFIWFFIAWDAYVARYTLEGKLTPLEFLCMVTGDIVSSEVHKGTKNKS